MQIYSNFTLPTMFSNFFFVNPFPHNDTFSRLGNKPFENIVGKGEIARNKLRLLNVDCLERGKRSSGLIKMHCDAIAN